MCHRLVAACLILLVLTPESWSQAKKLDKFLNKDLRKLSDVENRSFNTSIGEPPPDMANILRPGWIPPWYWWKATTDGPSRYILMGGAGLVAIPGDSHASFALYDQSLRKINSWSFSAGHRLMLNDASIEYSKDLKTDVILLETTPVINGADVAKQYFAFSEDDLRFIRMEDRRGELALNNYSHASTALGILPKAQNADEWLALLQSPRPADQLAALVFLGGEHRTRLWSPDPGDPQPKFLLNLVNDPRIRQSIQQLQKSANSWVRQAADLAARRLR